jgi:hypothetical protein
LETLKLWDKNARQPDDAMLTSEPLPGPQGFHGELRVYVNPLDDSALFGSVVAYGANVGRCFAAVFESTARGDGAHSRLATRLSLVANSVIGRIQVLSVEDRWQATDER